MTEDDSSSQQEKSWLGKLADAFSSDPQSREDLAQILRAAYENNLIDNDALEIIEGALKVSDQQVREIMIPRSKMVLIRREDSLETVLNTVMESNHSRFPVIGESADDVRGILLAKELLPLVLGGRENFDIDKVIRAAAIIPESKRLNVLLREFREQRYHMAIVVDEYGGVAGLVTIEDILEEIVGDIEDETDAEETSMIRLQDSGSHLVEALTPIEDFNEFFDAGLSDEEFDTIGGLIVQAFGRLPVVNESIEIEQFSFRIVEGDSRQVKLLEVNPCEPGYSGI
ncbi:MAG: transporter associated domain-containing protein [Porticoccaceae bacterium]|nr:CBS domain-containing protein [Pseudomonadales bacterium]MCP5172714.1 CBS domain-containing protein [Pseudomonadales bacterium]MCP5302188.1 CBS domain-containing protein [Pseudomonadales bacterium]